MTWTLSTYRRLRALLVASRPRSAFAAVLLASFIALGSNVATGGSQPLPAPAQQRETDHPDQANAHETVWLGFTLTDIAGEAAPRLLLSGKDADLYRSALQAQRNKNWLQADRALSRIKDRRLVGTVLAQRYLAKDYKTSYAELKAWLQNYADQPGAERLHMLASNRRPQGVRETLPAPRTTQGVRGGLKAAAVTGSDNSIHWTSGLLAWRQHDYEKALSHFQVQARNRSSSPWDQAAGAFWAARCLTRLERPAEVTPWLRRAASHARTFYGLLASQQLGVAPDLNWTVPELTKAHLETLSTLPAGARALALLQIGEPELAESELSAVHPRGNQSMETALIALASATRLPGLSLRLGAAITSANGKLYDAALYPLPRWEPDNGYEVDKALIYALVRQESQFNTAARSPAGAAGLMQLMPRTASYMTGRDFSQNNDTALNDPELNLTIGQKYVQHLLGQENIDNNLFFMLAAYNGGPTQARQWQRELEYGDDPLLFIETVTASETRNFIERVLANYWIYRQQLGAKTPSLEAVAAGQWPIYAPPHRLDVVRVANNITNPVN